jgi:hypothetical protein
MSHMIDFSQDVLPDPALIEALRADTSTDEKVTLLARLRQRVEKNKASLKEQARKFNEMCDEAGRALPVEGLVQLAERVHESEKGVAERLYPWIQALQQARAVPSQEGQQYIEELIEISSAWLAAYQDAHSRLMKLASGQQAATGEVLHARPVEGDIDYAELSREHIARYPRIRAALAE